ncbi:MAG: amino acid adenylation domain-containing protein, partial [Pseudonocardiaceae bacterium]
GDLVRVRPDGDLEFLGRIDDQVKLRGFRIEPDEIAATLREHPLVQDAVVVVRHDGGEDRLVAYATGTDPASVELRTFLADRLPAHLVPSAVVILAALPLSPSGKVDRTALPAPDRASAGLPAEPVGPRTPTEQVLTRLVSELLGVVEVGVDDDFFRLGGQSLLASMLAARVRCELGRELPLLRVYQAPTVAAMAVLLDSLPGGQELPPIVPVGREEPLPLSFPQERVWFLEQLAPGNLAYNAQATIRLRGPLDPDTLEATLTEIVRRHEIFRTRFRAVVGIPVQQPLPPMPIHLPLVDLSDLPEPERDDRADDVIWQAMRDPFDLDCPPLARWLLIRHTEADHTLVHVEHHFVHDGWSFAVFLKELQVIYSAFAQQQPSPLPAPPCQFADFAMWQRRWLRDKVLDRYLEFWTKELAGSPQVLDLPTDRPRPAMQSFKGAALRIDVPPALCRTLREFSRERGVTLYASMLAGFSALLHRYTGHTDLLVGCAAANRRLAETEQLIGMVVNTLVLRLDTSAQPGFDELLRRVHETMTRAYDWQDMPLDRLVNALDLTRDNSRNPLFQVAFSFHDSPVPDIDFAGLSGTVLEQHNGSAKTDLSIVVIPRAEQRVGRITRDDTAPITLIWEYATDLFDETTMHQMVAHYENLLQAALSQPSLDIGRLPMLTADEQQRMLIDYNNTATPIAPASLPALFEAQVRATPQAVAVVFADTALTYSQLNTQANQLAHTLIARDVGPEQIVAVALPRSPELVVAILAVLKAGAGYLPVDADYPAARIAFMLHDAQPALLLTSTQVMGCVPGDSATPQLVLDDPETVAVLAGCAGTDPTDADRTVGLTPQHPAYVIYTSGSTGAPKGVVVSHAGVASLAAAQIEHFEVGIHSRVLQFASPSFDASFWELCMGLLSGAALVVARTEQLLPGAPLGALARRQRVTHVTLPPSALAVLPVQDGLPPAVTVVVAGEACPPELVATWSTGRQMINAYGPTETTVCATMSHPLSAATQMPPPIGRPIVNTRVYVLDAGLQPVPPGVAGELYIGGAGLARGYLHQPGLTAQRFVADSYGPAGTRLYRTGDLVRWRADGDLEFLGRVDDQVKVRGFRIEPGEIETVLATHPDVAQAVVIAHEDHLGDKRLAAYAVAAGEGCRPDLLREYLRQRLPEYMVPAALVMVDGLPLTPNGKLDRDALPAPELGSAGTARAPRTPQEQLLAELFAEVLGLAGAGIDDDFFDLGGHSLLATRFIARIRATLGVELELRALFEAPTVAGLAARLRDAGQARLALTACERPDVVPLSFAQRRLWFLHQLEGPSPTYNIPLALRLSGELDRPALHTALADVVARHESLRTIFPQVDGVPQQQILDIEATCPRLTVTDTSETELSEALAAAARYEFDLATQPPVRAELFALAPDEHVLLLLVHHIAGDGWSMGPLSRDLAAAYQARCEDREPAWASLAVQYADYTLWQHRLLGNEADPDSLFARQMAYWTQALTGLPEQLELPTDRPRPAVASYRGDYLTVRVDAQLHRGLVGLARQGGASLFMVVQAGLAALLSRLGAGDDIPLGSPIAGRTDQALDDLVGFFVNTLVLRTDTSGDPTFGQLLSRAREIALAGYEHQDVPFEYLVEVLNPARSLVHHPLFQIMLVLQNTPKADFALPGLDTSSTLVPTGTAKFDLSFSLFERRGPDGSPDGLDVYAEYASDLFDPATVETLLARWVRLLEAMVADPDRPISRIDILTTEERHRLLVDYNNTAHPVAQTCLPALFETQVQATPQAAAVVFEHTTLTYTQLNKSANRLAHALVARGVGPEQIVALALPRSPDMIISILAVLKTGAAYLPVDPDYPPVRISCLLHDAQPALVLTNTQTVECVPPDVAAPVLVLDDADTSTLRDGCADTDPTDTDRTTSLLPGHPAYVIYTSGSTGQPKAVVVCHHSVVNLFFSHREGVLASLVAKVGGRRLRVAQTTSFSFDASWDQLLWMFAGHELHVVDEVTRTDPDGLVAYIARWHIDYVDATPSYVQLLVSSGLLDGGRWRPAAVVLGAEAVSEQLWDQLRSVDGVAGINFYGPTECTVDALMAWVGHSSRPAIGRPISNTRAYVLDTGLQPVPHGVTGELYLGGAGLARGYLRQPGLTAQRFVADPYGPPGTRMYRTGDLVRWNRDGNQEFVGRVDDQVKIRGYRIEPGEIETALG